VDARRAPVLEKFKDLIKDHEEKPKDDPPAKYALAGRGIRS